MNKKTLFFGLALIVLGGLLLMRTLDIFIFGFIEIVEIGVPLGFIVLGGWLIVRKRREEQERVSDPHPHDQSTSSETSYTAEDSTPGPEAAGRSADASGSSHAGAGSSEARPAAETPKYEGGRARYSGFLGDMFIDCQNINMQNVEISAFIGDVEVKLHGAQLSPGLSRMVVSGFVGDVRVLVPKEMAVFANGSSFIGDIEIFGRRSSGFGNNIDGQSANYQDAEAKLYIAINSFVGDIRVYEV